MRDELPSRAGQQIFTLLALSVVAAGFAMSSGCVERTMTLKSDPPGALVFVNDQEIGRTPLTREFLWYGDYDVQLRKEGYETLKTHQPVWAPIWEWVPLDLFAELLPIPLKDEHTYTFSMKSASTQPVDSQQLMERGEGLKGMLESSRAVPATTQPTTKPAS